ncbi:DUF262 domain-containing protein [Hymenobacter terricola]|uniref:DUF262 domain-containing protein n=1 Tax=Hymenobacter terricola TaxID=2819236 RepID=UPI001B301836|nr:DUF262 domain-containing protein [Hymenobacter terricola]
MNSNEALKETEQAVFQDIFKYQLKIESKVVSVETLFVNERRTSRTNYQPSYQRNYVWDDDKATYFIESILLGTEIPPIIFFLSGEQIEVIDGRQRYETIQRFIKKKFKLKAKGLLKLKDLKNKDFDDLEEAIRNIFWETRIRLIEFSFINPSAVTLEKEDLVKREIFKRYNSGITPLKSVEIDKAKYEENGVNAFIKKKFFSNDNFRKAFADIFFFDAPYDIEKFLKRLRQHLVIPYIPINYYSNSKAEIIERFFNHISDSTEDIEGFYLELSNKVYLTRVIKEYLLEAKVPVNRLMVECLFWAIQIAIKEGYDANEVLIKPNVLELIREHCTVNIESYSPVDSNFYKQIIERYTKMSELFAHLFNIDFDIYLTNSDSFREKNKALSHVTTDASSLSKFKSLRLNKPDASSFTIDDICNQMSKDRFLIRPTYQRNEVIDSIKSSAIIESILLGIKLPPIFIFKRDDGVSEVLDGQQRLLSILGFLGKTFIDENKRTAKSKKDKFSLKKLAILTEINGKRFDQISTSYQNRILDFDLWIIEINAESNKHFDPIDLFIRLNYKPFPILANTFEMWNSYIDRGIIQQIKDIYSQTKGWFYLRKDNKRMETETLISFLAYFEYLSRSESANREIPNALYIYRSGSKVNIRIKSKEEITKTLENPLEKQDFINSCKLLHDHFIEKVRTLITDDADATDEVRVDALNELMNVAKGKVRRYQSFYALWVILLNVSVDDIKDNKSAIRSKVTKTIKDMKTARDVKQFKYDAENFSFA